MIEKEIIKTKYGNIAAYKKGAGPKTILLLHGAGCDSTMLSWREVFNTFSDDFSVYAFDFLGYGQSDKANDLVGDRFFDTHIDCVRSVAAHYGLTDFALAGLSMGGAIAIGFALRYPDMVKALIPVDTALIGNKKLITDALVDEVMQSCSGDMAGKSMLNFQRSAADKDRSKPCYLGELKNLKMPVVYIIGEKDPLVPLSDIYKAAEENPDSRVAVFKGCKHWSVKEQPGKFCRIVNLVLQ